MSVLWILIWCRFIHIFGVTIDKILMKLSVRQFFPIERNAVMRFIAKHCRILNWIELIAFILWKILSQSLFVCLFECWFSFNNKKIDSCNEKMNSKTPTTNACNERKLCFKMHLDVLKLILNDWKKADPILLGVCGKRERESKQLR